ncbi:MAG: hypothetical protein PXZ08_01885 [Actinomycetota bacterium]|nr:hypothetical protein [Actinomycetota bacterium]
MGLRAMWFSAVTGVIGAIIWRMFTLRISGVDLRIVAVVFMLSGGVGIVASTAVLLASLARRARPSSPLVSLGRVHDDTRRHARPSEAREPLSLEVVATPQGTPSRREPRHPPALQRKYSPPSGL